MGDLSILINLPPHVKVHDVFHVSLLKPFVPDTFLRMSPLVPIEETSSFGMVSKFILDTQERPLRGQVIREDLVR